MKIYLFAENIEATDFQLTTEHIRILSEDLAKALIPYEQLKLGEELGKGKTDS